MLLGLCLCSCWACWLLSCSWIVDGGCGDGLFGVVECGHFFAVVVRGIVFVAVVLKCWACNVNADWKWC